MLTIRMIFMNDYGVKISKEGFNVLTAKDNELLFNSFYPSLKIFDGGTGSHTFNNHEGYKRLTTHNLGYKPFYAVWIDEGNGYNLVSYGKQGANFFTGFFATATTTTLELVAIATYNGGFWGDPTPPPNKTVDYTWIIFYDPIEDE